MHDPAYKNSPVTRTIHDYFLAKSLDKVRTGGVMALITSRYTMDKQVRKIAISDDVCRRLMTVPGVGPVIALMYKATIDNPYRFTKSNTVGAHLGLTPGKYASGEIDYDGHITRCGDEMMRSQLYEAAQVMLTRSGEMELAAGLGPADCVSGEKVKATEHFYHARKPCCI